MSIVLARPTDMFDRDTEWRDLVAFATSSSSGAKLGVVSGRRRQGKTYLLRAMCKAAGGFYFGAEEASDVESRQMLGAAIAEFTGASERPVFDNWRQAIDALLLLGRDSVCPVVIDEFPYLARENPALPSTIQHALAPLREERDNSRTRLLLCGSSMSFMGGLLAGGSPLRGRAGLEMVIRTFDHQLAKEYWSIADPTLAVKVNAIVGGTPAYRREFVDNDTPDGPDDFDPWVIRSVLSPTKPLFREARYLLSDELAERDTSLYRSVLAAIANGKTTQGAIANQLDRRSADLTHSLTVLEDSGLIERGTDAFRANRTVFHIAEPLITFYHVVMRPIWNDLETDGETARLWRFSRPTFTSRVLGPHFERICRQWTRFHASPELLGGYPNQVGTGSVSNQADRCVHEIDVVARAHSDQAKPPILLLGEAKWGEVMGLGHLDRLRRIRALLMTRDDHHVENARLACFSGVGFSDELLAEAARSPDILLVTVADLYTSATKW